jgi:hypothetical protein
MINAIVLLISKLIAKLAWALVATICALGAIFLPLSETLQFILISGNTILESSCDLGGAVFLPKPLDLEKLLRTVRGSPAGPSSQRE